MIIKYLFLVGLLSSLTLCAPDPNQERIDVCYKAMDAIMQNDTDKFLSLEEYSKLSEKKDWDFQRTYNKAHEILMIYGMPSKENFTVLKEEDQTTVKFIFHIAKDDKDSIEKAILSFEFMDKTPNNKFYYLSSEFQRHVQYQFVVPPNK